MTTTTTAILTETRTITVTHWRWDKDERGAYTVRTHLPMTVHAVKMTVDANALGDFLGRKAATNKTRRAVEAGGPIKAEALREGQEARPGAVWVGTVEIGNERWEDIPGEVNAWGDPKRRCIILPPTVHRAALYVDWDVLANTLGPRACRSKGKRSAECRGLVVATCVK